MHINFQTNKKTGLTSYRMTPPPSTASKHYLRRRTHSLHHHHHHHHQNLLWSRWGGVQ